MDQQQQLFIREERMLQSCRSHKDGRLGIDGDVLSRWCGGSQRDVSRTDWKAVNGGVKPNADGAGHFTWLLRPRERLLSQAWECVRRRARRCAEAARSSKTPNVKKESSHFRGSVDEIWREANRKGFLFSKIWFKIHYCPLLKYSQRSYFMSRFIKQNIKISSRRKMIKNWKRFMLQCTEVFVLMI